MEALCGLFETVSCLGDLLSRSDSKDQELCSLSNTVESISASVRAFVADMTLEERQDVFQSNKVWSDLLEQLKKCDKVIRRNLEASSQADLNRLEDELSAGTALTSFRRRLSNVTTAGRAAGRETLEALSGRMGRLGSMFRLPEDELTIIRESSKELSRLVPILQLAILAHGPRGTKRAHPGSNGRQAIQPSRPRFEALAGDAAGGPGPPPTDDLVLQLVSDYPAARGVELPVLRTDELRSSSTAASSTSVETVGSASENGTGSGASRKVFGRQELRDKVPRQLTMIHEPGQPPQSFSRFVSRDLFVVEVLPESTPTESDPIADQDTMEMPTLVMNGISASPDSLPATLVMGGISQSPPRVEAARRAIAMATGMARSGLHLQIAGETKWCWRDKDVAIEMCVGDRIALLLESPPGSYTPGPQRDLEADEARCLLGVEFHRGGSLASA
mmetsp:Transcript_64545/g.114785  ORF Transcript_64545/g.114785 Transcript_64545/m.114785 type:complete len:447 (-) Transcript_64545:41-1381(-)